MISPPCANLAMLGIKIRFTHRQKLISISPSGPPPMPPLSWLIGALSPAILLRSAFLRTSFQVSEVYHNEIRLLIAAKLPNVLCVASTKRIVMNCAIVTSSGTRIGTLNGRQNRKGLPESSITASPRSSSLTSQVLLYCKDKLIEIIIPSPN